MLISLLTVYCYFFGLPPIQVVTVTATLVSALVPATETTVTVTATGIEPATPASAMTATRLGYMNN